MIGELLVLQGRVAQVLTAVGMFFAKLKLDEIRGNTDDPATVKKRSAQLR